MKCLLKILLSLKLSSNCPRPAKHNIGINVIINTYKAITKLKTIVRKENQSKENRMSKTCKTQCWYQYCNKYRQDDN